MTTKNEIIDFIRNFSDSKNTFLNGCCYWFAYILQGRFGAEIYYDPIQNHFVGKIGTSYFDVTGEIYGDFLPWASYRNYDELDYDRVVRYCVKKYN